MKTICELTAAGVVTTIKDGGRLGVPSKEPYDVRLVRDDEGNTCLQARQHVGTGEAEAKWQTACHTGTLLQEKVNQLLGAMTHIACGTGMPSEFGHALVLSNKSGQMCIVYVHDATTSEPKRSMEFAIGATVMQPRLGAFCGVDKVSRMAKFQHQDEVKVAEFTPAQAMDLLKSAFCGISSRQYAHGRGMCSVLAFEAPPHLPHKPREERRAHTTEHDPRGRQTYY